MTSDRARVTYDPSRRYTGVVAQQGRVSLEADWNEAQAINSAQMEERTLDFIGPVASPDRGYQVKAVLDDGRATGGLQIHRGSLYVGGQRLSLRRDLVHSDQQDEADHGGQPDWADHSHQPDWADHLDDPLWCEPGIPGQPQELVYLLAREQEVSAVEDPALRDVALGGPDTSQRLRILQRVIRQPTDATTWEEAWAHLVQDDWIPRGFRLDTGTRRLEPVALLQVMGHPADGAEQPVDQGTYLGPNNQLIRVQITRKGDDDTPVLVWGYDNASFLYRLSRAVANHGADTSTLRLATPPVDAYHQPAKGQIVEVLRSAALLNSHDSIAASTGEVVTVTTAYAPDTQEVVVHGELPEAYQRTKEEDPQLYLRVWQDEIRCEPGKEHELAGTGIRIRLTQPQGARTDRYPVGAYWMIALRPGVGPDSPGSVYPQRIVADPQPPDGPRQWLAPLAFVRWHPENPDTEDLVLRFASLVREERSGGSCTVRVRPADVGGGWGLQDMIDTHAGRDHPATICLEPGIYRLPRPLRIGPRHGRLTLRAARPGVELRAEPEEAARFLLGLIIAREADGFCLEGLDIHPAHTRFVLGHDTYEHQPERARHLLAAHTHRAISIGLHAARCANLTVRDCRFVLSLPAPPAREGAGHPPHEDEDLFGAGIFGAEELRGLHVEHCTFIMGEPITHGRGRPDGGEAAEGRHHVALGFAQVPSAMAVLREPGHPDEKAPTEPCGSVSVPLLDDAVFRGNLFERLTAPVVVVGQTGVLRAEGNTARECHSGFWLVTQQASHVLTLLDRLVNKEGQAYRDLVDHHLTALAEPLLLHTTVLARTLPQELSEDLDAGVSPRHMEAPSEVDDGRATEFIDQLMASGSREEPAPAAAPPETRRRTWRERFGLDRGTRDEPVEVAVPPEAVLRCCLDLAENNLHTGLAPALVVLDTAPDSEASLILTGNRLRSHLQPGAAACLYLLRTCAATANVIVNEESGGDDGDDAASLLVLPRHPDPQHHVAITGNVLIGKAHLPDRPDGLPSWESLNSVTR